MCRNIFIIAGYFCFLYSQTNSSSYEDYNKALTTPQNVDTSKAKELFNLGKINTEEFLKYHNGEIKTVKNNALNPIKKNALFKGKSSLLYDTKNEFDNTRGNFAVLEYEGYAKEFYDNATKYLIESIKLDPEAEDGYCELSKLNIYNNTPEKAIPIWKSIKSHQLGKNGHLYLALLYYMTSQFEKSALEF